MFTDPEGLQALPSTSPSSTPANDNVPQHSLPQSSTPEIPWWDVVKGAVVKCAGVKLAGVASIFIPASKGTCVVPDQLNCKPNKCIPLYAKIE